MIDLKEEERFWNSLTKEQQLAAFCCVVRRLYKGELVDQGTYSYLLFDVFGFGPEAYDKARDTGFLELHNIIYQNTND